MISPFICWLDLALKFSFNFLIRGFSVFSFVFQWHLLFLPNVFCCCCCCCCYCCCCSCYYRCCCCCCWSWCCCCCNIYIFAVVIGDVVTRVIMFQWLCCYNAHSFRLFLMLLVVAFVAFVVVAALDTVVVIIFFWTKNSGFSNRRAK